MFGVIMVMLHLLLEKVEDCDDLHRKSNHNLETSFQMEYQP